MSLSTFDSLRQTLSQLRRRRRNLFLLKQTSYFVLAISAVFLIALGSEVWLTPTKSGSLALFVAMVAAIIGMAYWLLKSIGRLHSDDKRLAHYVEDHIPDLEQRLLTSLEFTEEDLKNGKKGVSQQFIQQLWEDAKSHVTVQQAHMQTVAPAQASWLSFASALSLVVIMGLVVSNTDSLFSAATRLAWPFAISEPTPVIDVRPSVEIVVEPGTIEMQRGESLTVIARVKNAIPATINLRLQDDNLNWRDLTMNRDGSDSEGATYSYFMPSVLEDTNYYVSFDNGGEESSPQYSITLYDLPQVEQIDLLFDYPQYTGLEDTQEDASGDMVVPVGTVVDFDVTFNKAVVSAVVEFDQGYADSEEGQSQIAPYSDINLSIADGNVGKGQFTVSQDGVYRITATDASGMVSLNPLDYFVRAIEDQPPELSLRRPGNDQEVMPLEEVVIQVEASDDYGLSQFSLNYSVVGADEVGVDFLPPEQTKQVVGDELIYLEDLKVEPGDFVSYYLTLADNNGINGPTQVVSDIYFLQVIPTDQEFRRSQSPSGQGAGGGQGGGDSSALVSVQKDIIAATWKLKNRQSKVSAEEFAGDAEIIAESQREATERARKSIERLAERLNFSDDTYDNAVENLSLAIEQMNLAAADLSLEQVTSALRPEQSALQYILKAEANINRTDISMQQGGGGGGGGSAQQEREDLRELFEMEMGQLENRYETPNSRSGGGPQQNSQEADKLEELARRQEGLTRAQRNLARREEQMTEEQKRRELERLQRQQEQLSQEVAQLAQQMSRGQQQSNQSQQSSQQSQSSSQSQSQSQSQASGGSSSSQQQSPLQRAAEQMQQAAQSDSASIAAARSQKALENLREQQDELGNQSERSLNQLAQTLGQRGQQLLNQQRSLQETLRDTIQEQGLGQTRQEMRGADALQDIVEKQQQQQRAIDEIEDMLRAIIARGDSQDQRLMSGAQAATRELRPIKEEMQTSNRVLRNGMLNLSVDIEEELQSPLEDLAQSLMALNPAASGSASDRVQQAANDAEALREQIEQLQEQVAAFGESGQSGQQGAGSPSIRELREQLQESQQLAQQLSQQVQENQTAGGQAGGGRQQIGGSRDGQQQGGRVGQAQTEGNNSALGNARSIRQQLTQQGIEDFLNQPELFSQLLQPIIELEGALRAQAELDSINSKLYAASDEDVPEAYRELVEEYYRVLSENRDTEDSPQ